MLRTIPSSVLAFALSATVFGQAPGNNDVTFSPLDNGYAIGDPSPRRSELAAIFSTSLFCMANDPAGRIIWAGRQDSETGWTIFVERRNADGSVDPSFPTWGVSGYGEVYAVAAQPDGKILLGGAFNTTTGNWRYNLIRLNVDGSVDPTFYNNANWGTGTTMVRAITLQPDGKIFIGGSFSQYGGSPAPNLTRLNSDGTRDTSWPSGSLGGTNGAVHAICLQPNGRVLIGGDFTQAAGASRPRIARLDMVTVFPANYWDNSFTPGTGCNAVVRSIALQPDGNILIGGEFTSVNGTPCERITRLTTGGAVDGSFLSSPAFNASVRSVSLRTDGSVLAGGDFTTHGGSTRNRIALVGPTGALVTTFDPGSGPNGAVYGVRALSNGKVLAFGAFTSCSGVPAYRQIRLDTDGGLDETYSFNGSNGRTTAVAVLNDGRMLVGGEFNVINGTPAIRLARLFPNGTVDAGFMPGIQPEIPIVGSFRLNDLIVQPDGKILAAGFLRTVPQVQGNAGFGIGRMDPNGALDPTFTAAIASGQDARALSLQSDGKIIAAISYWYGTGSSTLKRYNADGSVDNTFASGSTQAGKIDRTAVLPDGKVMVVGNFGGYAGSFRDKILRLNADGTIDTSFNHVTGFSGGVVTHILALPDGKCILSGAFTAYDGNPANGLCRLNTDGTFDSSFAPTVPGGGPLVFDDNGRIVVGARYRLNADGSTDSSFNTGSGFANAYGPTTPMAIAAYPNGIMAVGDFTSFNGTGRNRIVRIAADVPYSEWTLPVRVLLEGPFVQATNLMTDGLRTAGLIPTQEPFTALGFAHVLEPILPTVAASVLNPTTPVFNSIVDWVMLELRSAADPREVLQTRTGLLQRDGDIVGADGISPLVFYYPTGSYHVAVRHRNHAGCMTATPIALSTTNAMLNFSLPTMATFGTEGQKASGTRMVLWAGDATHNGAIKYTGSANDRDPILLKVGSTTPNNTTSGYFTEDVNMDGSVKYTGATNDRDPILVNVGSTTPNGSRAQQLP